MDKRKLLLGAIVVWFGFSGYWYVCKIKGQCSQSTNNEESSEIFESKTVDKNYTIYFAPSSAAYTEVEKTNKYLEDLAKYIKDNNETKVRLVGYTANLGRTAGYTQMANSRANVIKKKLVSLGVMATSISTEAKGIDGQSSTASDEEKAKSRKVEVYVE